MIDRSTNVRRALRQRQRGFIINPFRFGGGGGGATYSPWDVSSLPANVAASDGDFTLTRSGGSDASRIVSHPVTRASGKYALRFLCVRSPGNYAALGLKNGSVGTFLGNNANGWGAWCGASTVTGNRRWHNNANTVYSGAWISDSVPTEVMLEVDIGAGKAWWGINGTWLGIAPGSASAHFTGLSGTLTLVAEMYYPSQVRLLTPGEFTTPATSGYTPGWPD